MKANTDNILQTFELNVKFNIKDIMNVAQEELGIFIDCATALKVIKKMKKDEQKSIFKKALSDVIKEYIRRVRVNHGQD